MKKHVYIGFFHSMKSVYVIASNDILRKENFSIKKTNNYQGFKEQIVILEKQGEQLSETFVYNVKTGNHWRLYKAREPFKLLNFGDMDVDTMDELEEYLADKFKGSYTLHGMSDIYSELTNPTEVNKKVSKASKLKTGFEIKQLNKEFNYVGKITFEPFTGRNFKS